MKSQKLVLAVFLGLLASAAALVSALFMLQQLKALSTMPGQVQNLTKAVSGINSRFDGPLMNKRIDTVAQTVNKLSTDVENLKANQSVTTTPTTSTGNNSNNSTNNSTSNTQVGSSTQNNQAQQNTKTSFSNVVTTTKIVNLHSQPGVNSTVIDTTISGEQLFVVGSAKESDNYTWIPVMDTKGKYGWVAKSYTK